MSTTAAQARSPLAYPAFRALWCAAIVTFLGSFIQSVGEAWQMMDLTSTPLAVTVLSTAFVGSSLVAMLPGGVLADRFERRHVAIASQLLQGGTALGMAVLAATHHITPTALVLGVVLLGIGMAIGTPAWSALVPELLPIELVAEGIALNAVAFNMARAVGPALGGIVVERLGATVSFLLNAASFAVVTLVLLVYKTPPRPSTARSLRPLASTFGEPWRLCTGRGPLRLVFVAMLGFTFGAACFYALTPPFGRDTLHATALGYGAMIGAMGAGAVLGASIVKRLRARFTPRTIVTGTMLTFAVSVTLLARVPSVPAGMLLLVPAGAGWLGTFSSLSALAQLWAPDRFRARVIALYQMAHLGTWALASLVGGLVANGFGIRAAVALGGTACAVASFATWRLGLPPSFAGVRTLSDGDSSIQMGGS